MSHRRKFLKQSAIASAGVFLAPDVFSFHGSPNEKVVIGMMGTNSRGHYLAKMLAKFPNVEVGFICDVDQQGSASHRSRAFRCLRPHLFPSPITPFLNSCNCTHRRRTQINVITTAG